MFRRRAVFLDRDGTLIEAIHRPDGPKKITCPYFEKELLYVIGVHEALAFLKEAGFLRIMITNQPDVAQGNMTEDEWQKIHNRVITELDLDDYMLCRHTTADNCKYKKPSPEMLLAMADKWGIDLSSSYMIGDMGFDVEAGLKAGCRTILLDRFYNQDVRDADMTVLTLADAVKLIKLEDLMDFFL